MARGKDLKRHRLLVIGNIKGRETDDFHVSIELW